MIHYKNCSEVSWEKIYAGFKIGFSDYIIKFEMPQEDFIKRFFGPEGNELQYSQIALDNDEPVGLILGGIKQYEGVKTMRCGTLCIHPDYRGKGISQELFRLHKETALDNGCRQLFLEVIVGNDRAIKFYNNLGYEKIYDISYFTHSSPEQLEAGYGNSIKIEQINQAELECFYHKLGDTHINWQNDLDYMKKIEGLKHYGAYDNSELIAAVTVTAGGKVFFIRTLPEHRNKGIARGLLVHAIKELELKKLYISFTNNSWLEGFVRHLGFTEDKIAQYEMYVTL